MVLLNASAEFIHYAFDGEKLQLMVRHKPMLLSVGYCAPPSSTPTSLYFDIGRMVCDCTEDLE